MKVVFKYSLSETHKIPHSAKLLHAGSDPRGVLCAWFEVDTDNSQETIAFEAFGTGQEIPRGARHITTTRDGPFIWHFYAVDGRPDPLPQEN